MKNYKLAICIPSRYKLFPFIISLRGFFLFFKPIFSIRASYSFFMSNRITSFTKFSRFFKTVWRQWMSIFTMNLSSIDSLRAISSKTIDFLSYQFEMIWITTRSIPAKVIKLNNFSSRYFTLIKGIYNSMHSLSSSSIKSLAISLLVFTAKPVPTIRFFIYSNFIKKSFMFFWRKLDNQHFHSIYYTTI